MHPSTPHSFHDTLPDASVVDHLAELCAQELTAAHTYERALSLPVLSRHAHVLSRCYASHRNCAAALTRRITSLRGNPPHSGGVWGALLPALAASSAAIDEKSAIALLEGAEDQWAQNYRDEAVELDPASREFLEELILPAQIATYAALRDLRHLVHA